MRGSEQTPRLSGRLKAIVDMVSPGLVVCDVGCDHAHVPIALLKEGRIPSALAMDVIPGPLIKAGENLALYGEEDRVVLRLSDGLDGYRQGEAECLVVTGMGGRVICDILTREPEKSRDFTEMVLSPQADQWLVRQALRDLGYCIDREALILEDGKYYPVIHALRGRQVRPAWPEGLKDEDALEAEDRFGPVLLREKDPLLLVFLRWQLAINERILSSIEGAGEGDRHRERHEAISHTVRMIRTGLLAFDEEKPI
jgi:tRNA (adenine22-N1)-methyltransferase